jgi:hypothetical protein
MKSTTYKLSELLSILNEIVDKFGESSLDWDIELKYLVFPEKVAAS